MSILYLNFYTSFCSTGSSYYYEFSNLFYTKQIRETPHKRHHKFIEFYDVRAAEAALKALNRSDIAGKRIKLEPSRPGGARRKYEMISFSSGSVVFSCYDYCLNEKKKCAGMYLNILMVPRVMLNSFKLRSTGVKWSVWNSDYY